MDFFDSFWKKGDIILMAGFVACLGFFFPLQDQIFVTYRKGFLILILLKYLLIIAFFRLDCFSLRQLRTHSLFSQNIFCRQCQSSGLWLFKKHSFNSFNLNIEDNYNWLNNITNPPSTFSLFHWHSLHTQFSFPLFQNYIFTLWASYQTWKR